MLRTLTKFTGSLLTVAFMCFFASSASAQNPYEYQAKELMDYYSGLQRLGPNSARGYKIFQELQEHSGKSFIVLFGQTFQWGQAHHGGVIVIDISTLQKPKEILAYKLAHEWGHEDLGHVANLYNPIPTRWGFQASPTQSEDEADEYAGKFLAANGYELKPVLRYLMSLPLMPGDFSHSSGPKRACLVGTAYANESTSTISDAEENILNRACSRGSTNNSPAVQNLTNICQTSFMWCSINQQGPAGTPCWCNTPNGPANGNLVPR